MKFCSLMSEVRLLRPGNMERVVIGKLPREAWWGWEVPLPEKGCEPAAEVEGQKRL